MLKSSQKKPNSLNLSELENLCDKVSKNELPPIHTWKPQQIGKVDIRIAANGKWFYQDSEITRKRIVKLFSKILKLEESGHYFLVTPIEKMQIKVEEAPFIATQLRQVYENDEQQLYFQSNVDEIVLAGKEHPIEMMPSSENGQLLPFVHMRAGLYAKLSRSVYYELIDIAISEEVVDSDCSDDAKPPIEDDSSCENVGVWSSGVFFNLIESK